MGDIDSMSWEECVEASCVNGNPGTLRNAGTSWGAVFRNADSVKGELDRLIKELDDWKGPAGKAYRDNIKKISDAIQQIRDDNEKKVTGLLEDCASSLDTLQGAMPIPADMYDEVQWCREQAYDRNAMAVGALMGGIPGEIAFHFIPNDWKKRLFDNAAANLVGDALGWLSDKIDNFFNDREGEARDLLSTANNDFDGANITAGNPKGTDPNLSTNSGQDPTTSTGPGSDVGSPPSTGHGGTPKTPNLDTKHPDYNDPWKDKNTDPNYDPYNSKYDPSGAGGGHSGGGSGLAGAGGGPSGAGPDAAGLGGSPSGTAGSAGKAVGLDGALAGAGRAAGRGMMGGGGGRGGHGGAEDGRETWLTEDEDPWGADDDSNPSVLGA